ncbi:hypothetical protein BDN70DRAFT_850001 [Pholiota conissans]|uniref:PX domain-containing protein n=1 Tax=Pholiota conissans TaxID=109636 RepID=A0A9P5ZB38_9AGAR|nr:hypothetical protein BDN70DRAFT_850001 [Pholiota conissans]
MFMSEPNASVTQADNGMPSDQYKRAVLQPPPSRFMVEFLVATKSNGSYHHGMHISPIRVGDTMSVSSRRSISEYDIWRRWEDCLWFQDTLEQEYARAAREKKTRLQQGKGVKAFNGMYKQDMASSWESLPPGPDPSSVAQDIHGYLPRLTKKGTLFRASQSTIEMRQKEFRNLIETLFSGDMPALIQEIRASTIVTDFFGIWRRDYDNMDRPLKSVRSSVSSSIFSSYFSESTTSLSARSARTNSSSETTTPASSLPNSPSSKRSSRSSSGSNERPRSLHSDISEVTRYPQSSKRLSMVSIETISESPTSSPVRPRRRPVSSASSLSDSSSTHSDGSSDSASSTLSTGPAIVEDVPFVFGHNPQSGDRPSTSILEVLPEERDVIPKSQDFPAALLRRPKTANLERRANRTWSILEMPSNRNKESKLADRNVRESWQTTDSLDVSASEIMDGLNLSLPHPIKDNKYRESMASISTFMTTDSADAVIPRNSTPPCTNNRESRPRISTTLSLSDFEIYSDCDDDTDSVLHRQSILDSSSILDAFPRPNSYLPESFRAAQPDSRPETPTGQYLNAPASPLTPLTPVTPDFGQTSFDRPPSPMSTISTAYTFSTVTSSISPGSFSVKAAHNSSIVLLRVSPEMSLVEVRQRIYNKFVGQEGIPLANDFTVAFAPSTLKSPKKEVRKRPSASSVDDAELQFISSDSDWAKLIASADGSKITLRILDPK